MGSVKQIMEDWAVGDSEKESFIISEPDSVLRWINNIQLQFVNKGELLETVWSPVIDSTGKIDLPSNFLRELGVLYSDKYLDRIDYEHSFIYSFSDVRFYSIYGNSFYVIAPNACTLTIPHLKKPASITDYPAGDLEIPSEFQDDLIIGLESLWMKRQKRISDYVLLKREFEDSASRCAWKMAERRKNIDIVIPRKLT